MYTMLFTRLRSGTSDAVYDRFGVNENALDRCVHPIEPHCLISCSLAPLVPSFGDARIDVRPPDMETLWLPAEA